VKDGAKVDAGDVLAILSDGEKVLSEVAGTAKVRKGEVGVIFEGAKVREYIIPPGTTLIVKDDDEVLAGDPLTEGNLDLQVLFKHKGQGAVQKYLSKEIQFIYTSQGQKVNNKHIEVIIRQMFSRAMIGDPGDTSLLPGEIVPRASIDDENDLISGKDGKESGAEDLFLGITKISLSTDSWLSAASFQETARVLINAAVTGKIDKLEGLKENVIIGRLIPAGTGFNHEEIHEEEPTLDRDNLEALPTNVTA